MRILSYNAYVQEPPYRAQFPKTQNRLFAPMDLLLQYLQAREPQILEQVIPRLLERLRGFTAEGSTHDRSVICAEVGQEYTSADHHPDLFRALYTLQRELLGVDEQIWISKGSVEVSQAAFIRALYVPQYLVLKSLIDVLGKPRGVTLMKECLDWACLQGPDAPNSPATIDDLRIRQVEGNLRGKGMNWIAAVVSEHEYRNKVTVCGIQRALTEYDDNALMEIVACYPDFTMFRKINANFCLTRTRTLMNGGDCCDMCYHDERYVIDFVHPSAEAFVAMEAE